MNKVLLYVVPVLCVSSHVVYVWKYVFVLGEGVLIFLHKLAEARDCQVPSKVPDLLLPYFLKQVSVNLELTNPTRLCGPASELQASAWPGLLCTGTARVCCQTWLFLWMLGTQTQVLLLVQQSVTNKPSPQPLEIPYSKPITWFVSLPSSTENNSQNHH